MEAVVLKWMADDAIGQTCPDAVVVETA